jgi:hypothetical protein
MSLDKAIIHNKEFRKPYRGAKAIDSSCRNHGTDSWSMEDRLYKSVKSEPAYDPNDEYDLEYRMKPRNSFHKEANSNYGSPHYAMSNEEYRAFQKRFGELLKR